MLIPTTRLFRGFILQHLRARKFRSLLSISGIVFGVTILVAVLLTNRAVTSGFSNTMVVLAGRADLQVYSDWAGLDQEVLNRIRQDEDVKFAAPVLEITANLPKLQDGLLLVGIDYRQDPRVRIYASFAGKIHVPDLFTLTEDKNALIVTDTFLKRHSLKLNDSIEIITPQGLKPFNIRGSIESEGNVSAMTGNWALMEIKALRTAFERPDRPSRIDVFLREPADADTVRERLARAMGPTINVDRPWMRSRAIEKMIGGFQLALTMLGFVALLVGVFLIYNTTSISVIERCREIGILRTCGATRRQILSIFLLEGFVYGVIGAAVGLVLGIGAAKVSLSFVGNSISSAYFIFLRIGDLKVSPSIVALGMLFGVGASVIGALHPALAASRLYPVEAVKRSYRTDVGYNARNVLMASIVMMSLAALALALRFALGVKYSGYPVILLLLASLAISSPLTVALLTKAMSGTFRSWYGFKGRLAVENTLRNPTRTGVTAAALIIGLAIIINTSGTIASLRSSMATWIGRIFSGDIIIVAHNPFTAGSVSAPLDESFMQDLQSVEGVSQVSAIRYAKITYGEYLISLLAVDGFLPGSGLAASDSDTIHVSKNFAQLFQIKPGDQVTLATDAGQTNFVVADLIEDYNYNWPKGTIIVDRELYKKYWADRLVDQIVVYLETGVDLETVSREMKSRYAAQYNLTVFSNREFRNNFMQIIDQQFSLTYAELLITVVIVLFAVTNTLLISVIGRRREIGILRAVGASQRQNRITILLEAVLLGLAGVVYGTVLGLLITLVFLKVSLPEDTGWTVSYVFPTTGWVLSFAAALVVSVLGSIIPLREIGKLPISEMVRYE